MPGSVTMTAKAAPGAPLAEIHTLVQGGAAAAQLLDFEYVGPARLVAGSLDRWQFRFRAKQLLRRGSRIAIAHRWPSDWGTAQSSDPGAADFLRVDCDAGSALRWWAARLHTWHPFDHVVFVEFLDDVAAEAMVRIAFGGNDGDGPGFHVQSFIEEASPFSVRWRPRDAEHWAEIGIQRMTVIGAAPFRLVATVPSRVRQGEPVRLRLRLEDAWGNPAHLAADVPLVVTVPGEAVARPAALPRCAWVDADIGPLPAGMLRLRVEAPTLGLACISNALDCHDGADESNVYWADLHAQSVIGCGARTIDDYYAHARGFAALDVCSHQANCFLVSEPEWVETMRSTQRQHEPAEFVTLLGYEWSAASPQGGDHNVYFPGDAGELRRCSHEFVRDRSDLASDLPHVEDFYRHFRPSVPLVAVHVGGRTANLKWHEPALERLLEVHSTHATSEWFLHEALARGYRMGVVAGSDSVDGRPGNSHPGHLGVRNVRGGLTAIRAEALTRESIWSALTRRHCYATTGERILLEVRCGAARMGDDLRLAPGATRLDAFEVRVEGTAPVEAVDFYRDTTCLAHVDRLTGAPSRRLRVAWRGASSPGNWQRARMQWNGGLRVEGNAILRVEGYAFDTPDEGLLHHDRHGVRWRSLTAGDWDGVVLDLEGDEGELVFATDQISARIPLREIGSAGRSIELTGPDRCVELRWLPQSLPSLGARFDFADAAAPIGTHAYWVRVRQLDGGYAWSSPVFVTIDEAGA